MFSRQGYGIAVGLILVSFLIAASFTVLSASAEPFNLTVKLTIPGTSHQVYVPGNGTSTVSQLNPGTWTAPTHQYLASWLSGQLYSLVHSYQTPISVGFDKTPDNHTLILTQKLENSQAFLVFTEGDWKAIDNRMRLIEGLDFLTKIAPTFGSGLGHIFPIRMLVLSDDSLLNSLVLGRGTHDLEFENIPPGIAITG